MAETHSIDPFGIDFSADAPRKQSGFRRLSLLNGLLIGLAFGLGAWGPEMLRVARLPVASYLPTLLLGMGLVVALCGFVSSPPAPPPPGTCGFTRRISAMASRPPASALTVNRPPTLSVDAV